MNAETRLRAFVLGAAIVSCLSCSGEDALEPPDDPAEESASSASESIEHRAEELAEQAESEAARARQRSEQSAEKAERASGEAREEWKAPKGGSGADAPSDVQRAREGLEQRAKESAAK